MKKYLLSILILLVSSIVTAGELNTSKIYTVAFAQDTLDNDFRLAQVKMLEKEFSKYPNINFIYSDGKANSALQIKQIEDFIAQRVDILMTSPYDEVASTQIISKAYNSGIPVVLVGRTIKGNDYTSYIHPENTQIALDATRYLVKKMNYKGHVLLLKGIPQADPTRKRTDAFYKILTKYPKIKVTEYTANYLRRDAIIGVDKLLNTGLQFDAIMSQSDSMLVGARMALQTHDIDPSSLVTVGIDYIKEAKDAISKGKQNSSFMYSLSAKESAHIVLKILKGEHVPKEVKIPTMQVTKENVHDVEPIF